VRAWRDGLELDPGTPQQRAVLAVLPPRVGGYVSAEDLVADVGSRAAQAGGGDGAELHLPAAQDAGR
jgi:hypothetical protein